MSNSIIPGNKKAVALLKKAHRELYSVASYVTATGTTNITLKEIARECRELCKEIKESGLV